MAKKERENLKSSEDAKHYGWLERTVKSVANRRRIRILELLDEQPELSVDEIAEILKMNYLSASDHVRKLAIGGMVLKRQAGKNVRHKLTERAKRAIRFLAVLREERK